MEQGEVNCPSRFEAGEAVWPLFKEFISCPETEKQIADQRNVLEQMLDAVPVWKFVNLGDEVSVDVLHRTMEEYVQNNESVLQCKEELKTEVCV